MRITYERVFRVRHYECDAYERVYYTNYFRYIQEAALDASGSAGFDTAWYAANGCMWLVRETEVEFLSPVGTGDSVRVKTWVKDMRQARSCRMYEVYRGDTQDLVARAETDWVFIDANGKPARIPESIRTALMDVNQGAAPPRKRFPAPPDPGDDLFSQRRRVEWRDIDPIQHVNNSVYVAYAEDAAVEANLARGWSPSWLHDRGVELRFKRFHIEYRVPAVLGDDLIVMTWESDREESTCLRHFRMVRESDGALLARARAEVGCVTLDGEAVGFPG